MYLFCVANSPKPKSAQLAITYNREKQQIFTKMKVSKNKKTSYKYQLWPMERYNSTTQDAGSLWRLPVERWREVRWTGDSWSSWRSPIERWKAVGWAVDWAVVLILAWCVSDSNLVLWARWSTSRIWEPLPAFPVDNEGLKMSAVTVALRVSTHCSSGGNIPLNWTWSFCFCYFGYILYLQIPPLDCHVATAAQNSPIRTGLTANVVSVSRQKEEGKAFNNNVA